MEKLVLWSPSVSQKLRERYFHIVLWTSSQIFSALRTSLISLSVSMLLGCFSNIRSLLCNCSIFHPTWPYSILFQVCSLVRHLKIFKIFMFVGICWWASITEISAFSLSLIAVVTMVGVANGSLVAVMVVVVLESVAIVVGIKSLEGCGG